MASFDLAVAFGEIEQYSEAEQWFDKTLKIREQVWGKQSFGYNRALHNMGVLKNRMKKSQEAITYLQPALEFFRKDPEAGPEDVVTINVMTSLAMSYTNLGRLEESERLLMDALRLISKNKQTDEVQVAYGIALRELAVTQHKANRLSESRENIALSLNVLRNHLPKGHVEIRISESRNVEISKESVEDPFQAVTTGGPLVVVSDPQTMVKVEAASDSETILEAAVGTQFWVLQTNDLWQRVYLPEQQKFGWIAKKSLKPKDHTQAEIAALADAKQQVISASKKYHVERDLVAAENFIDRAWRHGQKSWDQIIPIRPSRSMG